MKRRKAREYVLQFLYACEMNENTRKMCDYNLLQEEIEKFWERNNEEQDHDIKTFANQLIEGTIENIDVIDKTIQKYTEKWHLERIIPIDKNILRFSIYEILFRHDIPYQVTINEAVEIAKKYSTKESAAFINGILDKVAKKELSHSESAHKYIDKINFEKL
ncbi:MAG: transcription antitermination factor NusB [Thermodesulfovibrio sp.]|jgi:N utilization substance protein B|uniref:Transcription antitermination protein NusB n=1 Tax=Thermodesulfovibrio obliviosus TaxID=3118332 RepID=A0AAU8H3D6_9BACT